MGFVFALILVLVIAGMLLGAVSGDGTDNSIKRAADCLHTTTQVGGFAGDAGAAVQNAANCVNSAVR